jgi:hypothetical protein
LLHSCYALAISALQARCHGGETTPALLKLVQWQQKIHTFAGRPGLGCCEGDIHEVM